MRITEAVQKQFASLIAFSCQLLIKVFRTNNLLETRYENHIFAESLCLILIFLFVVCSLQVMYSWIFESECLLSSLWRIDPWHESISSTQVKFP